MYFYTHAYPLNVSVEHKFISFFLIVFGTSHGVMSPVTTVTCLRIFCPLVFSDIF